jgi:hypothetical protein
LFIPDPDLLPITDPEGQKGTGSRIRICNTVNNAEKMYKRTVLVLTIILNLYEIYVFIHHENIPAK